MKILILLSSFLILIAACNFLENENNSNSNQCLTKPIALFSDTMTIVKQHSFTAKGTHSTEEVLLTNNVKVEVLQSGCEHVKQEFRFTRIGDYSTEKDGFWINVSLQTLGQLSDSSPVLAGLAPFATAIAENLPKIKLGQPFVPTSDQSYSITIDKITTKEEGLFWVIIQVL